MELSQIQQLLLRASEGRFPEGVKHVADADFPGMYAIVLARRQDDGCLTRLLLSFDVHQDLRHHLSPFLWHAHGYSFTATVLTGHAVNFPARVAAVGDPQARTFMQYKLGSSDDGQRPTLQYLTPCYLKMLPREVCYRGESFSMDAHTIHRVTFHPDGRGVFACLVEEHLKHDQPQPVYCPYHLQEMPHADQLYSPLSDALAAAKVRHLLAAVRFLNPGQSPSSAAE